MTRATDGETFAFCGRSALARDWAWTWRAPRANHAHAIAATPSSATRMSRVRLPAASATAASAVGFARGAPEQARGGEGLAIARRRPRVGGHRRRHLGLHAAAEAGLVEAGGVARAILRIDGNVIEPEYGLDQLLGTAGPEAAGDAVEDRLQRATTPPCDHRASGGLALDGG